MTEIEVIEGDILNYAADILILKHPKQIEGELERTVVKRLRKSKPEYRFKPKHHFEGKLPSEGQFKFYTAPDSISTDNVLFVGVKPLRDFSYQEIRLFVKDAFEAIGRGVPQTRHACLTLHGTNCGFDVVRSFEAELAGILDVASTQDFPEHLEKISFIEIDQRRVERMNDALNQLLPERSISSKQDKPIETTHSTTVEYESLLSENIEEVIDDPALQRELLEELAYRKIDGMTKNRFAIQIYNELMQNNLTDYDAFICHASEDKEDFVRPLADELTDLGLTIWYDEYELEIGDSIRQSIDKGLSNADFGIVVLSTDFFEKNWTQYELNALVTQEIAGQKVILPIWYNISKGEIMSHSPALADKLAVKTGEQDEIEGIRGQDEIEDVAQQLSDVIQS